MILCTAPNGKTISELIPGLGRNGQAIIVTGSTDMIQIPAMLLLGGQRSVKGFVSGNMEDTLKFSVITKVIPMVEVFPMDQVKVAYEKMMTAKVMAMQKRGVESNPEKKGWRGAHAAQC